MRNAAFVFVIFLAGFATTAKAGSGFDLYGNWCGPGTNVDAGPPLDPLDAACMHHDLCYISIGTASCECDVGFMRELRSIPYPNEDTFLRSRAMYDAVAMTPCDDPSGWALKQNLMWNDIADDVLNGRATPMEVPARWMYLFTRSNPYR